MMNLESKNQMLEIEGFIRTLENWKPFIAKTRGNSLEERYSNLLTRFRKVDENHSDDDSQYRRDFVRAHIWTIDVFENSEPSNLEYILGNAILLIRDQLNTPNLTNGYQDGYAMIALEIYDILDGSNV